MKYLILGIIGLISIPFGFIFWIGAQLIFYGYIRGGIPYAWNYTWTPLLICLFAGPALCWVIIPGAMLLKERMFRRSVTQ
jgi:hypothetical protein